MKGALFVVRALDDVTTRLRCQRCDWSVDLPRPAATAEMARLMTEHRTDHDNKEATP